MLRGSLARPEEVSGPRSTSRAPAAEENRQTSFRGIGGMATTKNKANQTTTPTNTRKARAKKALATIPKPIIGATDWTPLLSRVRRTCEGISLQLPNIDIPADELHETQMDVSLNLASIGDYSMRRLTPEQRADVCACIVLISTAWVLARRLADKNQTILTLMDLAFDLDGLVNAS
jgi:hypothetical protein